MNYLHQDDATYSGEMKINSKVGNALEEKIGLTLWLFSTQELSFEFSD